MRWFGSSMLMTDAAAGAIVRFAVRQPSRRTRYGVPVLLVTVLAGLALAFAPAIASRGLFQALLVPVLLVALTLGLRGALVAMGLGVVLSTFLLPPLGLPWLSEGLYLTMLGLFVAEALTMAFIGAIVRAAIRMVLEGRPAAASPEGVTEGDRPRIGHLSVERLTDRETEVLRAAASGRSVDELADELFVSPNTVKTHLAHCYDKLGAHNRAEAIALAVHAGCLDSDDLDRAATASLAS